MSVELVFGTAQLGLPYGVANRTGQPSFAAAEALLADAARAGVRWVDTARAYGTSEALIGRAMQIPACSGLKVITKITPLDGIAPHDAEAAVAALKSSLASSFLQLRTDHLDVVVVHRAIHRTAWGGKVWHLLLDQCASGRIGRLGVSAQTPAEVLGLISDPDVRHVQLPTNIVDWRWDAAAAALSQRPDIVVHVRSAYLQGLLVSGDPSIWPRLKAVQPELLLSTLTQLATDLHCDGVDDLCVRYVRGLEWVNGLVLGMETKAQLVRNLDLVARKPLLREQIDEVRCRIPPLPETLLNPALWNSQIKT